jgi:site-specific DNA recombinase
VENAAYLPITRVVSMKNRQRGVEMRLIIKGNGAPAPRADLPLLKAVARAHQWSHDLLAGRTRSIDEIAERQRIGARYVRRLMRLAFLAPKIVEVIAAGSAIVSLETGTSGSNSLPSASESLVFGILFLSA